MAANASRVRRVYDAHASVVFRAPASASITADEYSSALSLNELDLAYWQADGEIPYGKLVIGVLVEAINLNAGAAIVMSAQVDDTNNMSDTPTKIDHRPVSAVGYFEFVIPAKDIPKFDAESSGLDKWIALHIDLTAGQSISYHAWIARSEHP